MDSISVKLDRRTSRMQYVKGIKHIGTQGLVPTNFWEINNPIPFRSNKLVPTNFLTIWRPWYKLHCLFVRPLLTQLYQVFCFNPCWNCISLMRNEIKTQLVKKLRRSIYVILMIFSGFCEETQMIHSPFYSATSIFAVFRNTVPEIWFEKSGSRNLVREKWLTRKKGGFIP